MILEAKIFARFVLRRMKLTSFAHRIRMLWHKSDYEDRFADAFLAFVKPDDCVWDVGANVGYYTERLSKLARYVVAFEPVPESCGQIDSKGLKNVECLPIALGDQTCEMPMFIDHQFSSLALASSAGARPQTVRVARGDDLTSLPRPTVIKVDVEGYELEVIRGMHEVLNHVRALFLEVHFQILEDRGMRLAPATLVKDLKGLGFSKITWPDASHIAAFRM